MHFGETHGLWEEICNLIALLPLGKKKPAKMAGAISNAYFTEQDRPVLRLR